jgi:hypothetical protein
VHGSLGHFGTSAFYPLPGVPLYYVKAMRMPLLCEGTTIQYVSLFNLREHRNALEAVQYAIQIQKMYLHFAILVA